MMKPIPTVLLVGALLVMAALTGCSSGKSGRASSATPTPTPQPTQTETGRIAFQKLYIQAHMWAPDAQGYLVESQPTKEVTGVDGKSAVWSAHFGSRTRGMAKGYVWSGTDALDAPSRGTEPGSQDSFSPNNLSTQTFDVGFVRSDTDQAFKVAQEHGGKELLAKEPTLPVTYRLEWNSRDNGVAWHVIYGKYKLSVSVDASTGTYLRIDR
jgi:hypothetical protein